ncbi:hypothetical protein GCM10009677_29770 [Sphaerisporangium rubeum]|uniref:Uncharacterized protein n=1 Tax=Sphaerisporangium rubeum TaxID=321317 RepID=A0A7X0IGS3_9ACTN|nr:hypothetical protein [Sphaerisporangium rubeum]MBB6473683.1 hypothetical protein [Sphaerisporangium rubeum]
MRNSRTARTVRAAEFGATAAGTLHVTSKAYGHEGGDDVTVALAARAAPSSPLTVAVTGKDVTVGLAGDAAGAVSSTAAQVVAALNGDAAASVLDGTRPALDSPKKVEVRTA